MFIRTNLKVCVLLCPMILSVQAEALTLAEALQNTLENSPQLAVYPYEQRAAEARALQAGLRPNPELEMEVENVAGSGDYSGTQNAEYTLTLSQVIELGDKRQSRQALAKMDGENVQQSYALARVEVLAEATRRYIEVARALTVQDWSKTFLQSTQRAQRLSQQRVDAGAASAAEANQLTLAMKQAELTVQRASSDVAAKRLRLAASWGGTQTGKDAIQHDLFRFPELPPLEKLQQRLLQSPHITRYLTEQRLRAAQLRLAESGATSNVNIGMGVRHWQEVNDNALVFSISMPLAINDRKQGDIAAARADMEKNNAEQSLAQIELQTLLQTLYIEAETSRSEALQLHKVSVPLAEKIVRDIESGYSNGRYSALEVITAQQNRQTLERDSIEAASSFHLLLLELERLTGEPMTGSASVSNIPSEKKS